MRRPSHCLLSMPRPSSHPTHTIRTLGDQALVIDYGSQIDPLVNEHVCAVALALQSLRWAGVVDVVPAFSTITVHLRLDEVERPGTAAPLRYLQERLESWLGADVAMHPSADEGEVEIPVCYGGVHGPDLAEAAAACGMSIDQLISLHQAPARVYMLGFAPGAPYIGLYDERMSLPRRLTPRLRVPAGSVGIANRQCVVYPLEAPGGWSLIGRTPLRFFDADRAPPALLRPGSRVRFKAIEESQFRAWPAA